VSKRCSFHKVACHLDRFQGNHRAIKAGLPAEVVHCIESHREPDLFERSYEAKIVLYSDKLHADAMLTAHPEVSPSF